MLNYRNTLIFFILLLIVLFVIDYLIPVSLWIYAIVIALFILTLVWGAKSISSGFFLHTVCRGNSTDRQIALTFDDGPDAQVTPLILDVLKKHQVQAVFFIIGSKAEKHPEIIKRIFKEGHLLGSHSYSHHFFFDLFSFKRMRTELRITETIISEITGKKIKLFRPPYGVTNPILARTIRQMEYDCIGWSLKSNDTIIEDETVILNNLISRLKMGDIVLFHDNKPWTINVTDRFIHYLKENNFSVTRLDTLLNIHAYAN